MTCLSTIRLRVSEKVSVERALPQVSGNGRAPECSLCLPGQCVLLCTRLYSLLEGFLDPVVLAEPEAVQRDRGVDSGPRPWHSLGERNEHRRESPHPLFSEVAFGNAYL